MATIIESSFDFECHLAGLQQREPDLTALPFLIQEMLQFRMIPFGAMIERGPNRGAPRLDAELWISPAVTDMPVKEFISLLGLLEPSILSLKWATRTLWLFNAGDEAELTLEPALLDRLASLRLPLLVTS